VSKKLISRFRITVIPTYLDTMIAAVVRLNNLQALNSQVVKVNSEELSSFRPPDFGRTN